MRSGFQERLCDNAGRGALTSASESTLKFREESIAALLARAGHLIIRPFGAELRRRRMPVRVWRVLSTLADGDGVSVGQLADLTLSKQPTLTRLLDRMSESGLVERRPSASDHRKVLIFITAEGRERLGDLRERAREHEQTILANLVGVDIEQVKSTLRALIARCRSQRERPSAQKARRDGLTATMDDKE
jgi:DNA-binding MarR family transcriptional regulator